MFDLVELQRKLQEARNEKIHTPNSGIISKYRLRTPTIEKDAIELLELGVNPSEISNLLGIRLSEVARIKEDNPRRRKFLMTGNLDLPEANRKSPTKRIGLSDIAFRSEWCSQWSSYS